MFVASESSMSTHELAEKLLDENSGERRFAFSRKIEVHDKREARNKVLSLFSQREFPRGLSILTMPSTTWKFEKNLLVNRERRKRLDGFRRPERTYICAIEQDEAIYRAALMNMPGAHVGSKTLVQLDAEPFATTTYRTYLIQRFHRCSFQEIAFYHANLSKHTFDAAWLDFCGPLSISQVHSMREFWQNTVRKTMVVTYMKSRGNSMVNEVFDYEAERFLQGEVLSVIEYGQMRQVAVRK